jgi:hypothetical protein
MSTYGVVTTSYILFNSVAFAGKVTSAVLTLGKEVIDISTYTAATAAARAKAIGMENHKLDLTVHLDMAASGAGSTFNTALAAWVAGVAFPVYYRLDIAAASATNPEFRCNYILANLPIGQAFGAYGTLTLSLESSGVMTVFTG